MRTRTLLVALLGLASAILVAQPLPAQLRTLHRELIFTPLTPCRTLDSRGFEPLRPGQVLALKVNGFCGVRWANAVAVNIVAVDAEGPGHLTAWPAHQSKPLASVINYNAGATIANGLVLEICDAGRGALCPSGDLWFEAAVNPTHLVVDVVGFFAPVVRPEAFRYGAGGVEQFPCVNSGQAVKFGLSHMVADWTNAERACPAGTWVCSLEERGNTACNTTRPDGTCDLVVDDGVCSNLPADAHRGWTRPRSEVRGGGVTTVTGTAVDEMGAATSFRFGSQLPVWCCSPF